MHVRCPNCETVFRVAAETLDIAEGRVRCGRCRAVFDGRTAGVPLTTTTPPPATVARTDAESSAPHSAAAEPGTPTTAPPATPGAPSADPEEVLALEAELAAAERRPRPGRTLLLSFANVLLAGLLGWQLFLGLHEPLLASPDWRPLLERACGWAGCRLPALRDPDRVDILAREVRPHPRYADALLVDLTLVNRAGFAQPFPVLQLTFTSLDEQWFAQRRFAPAEYLGPNRGAAERLPPDIPVQVVLELFDPGPQAISFAFEFH